MYILKILTIQYFFPLWFRENMGKGSIVIMLFRKLFLLFSREEKSDVEKNFVSW